MLVTDPKQYVASTNSIFNPPMMLETAVRLDRSYWNRDAQDRASRIAFLGIIFPDVPFRLLEDLARMTPIDRKPGLVRVDTEKGTVTITDDRPIPTYHVAFDAGTGGFQLSEEAISLLKEQYVASAEAMRRHDPRLIKVILELGSEASREDSGSDIQVITVTGESYAIIDDRHYDGFLGLKVFYPEKVITKQSLLDDVDWVAHNAE